MNQIFLLIVSEVFSLLLQLLSEFESSIWMEHGIEEHFCQSI